MKHQNRGFRNIILPAILLLPLLWLMVGCFYVPWFEHRTDDGPNVRAMVGPADSKRQIRPGLVTREQVHAVLGDPVYHSLDDTCEGYVAHTSYGFWVVPLCFTAFGGSDKAYVVRIQYDGKGTMRSYEWAEEMTGFLSNASAEKTAVMKLNSHGPKLLRVDGAQPSTYP